MKKVIALMFALLLVGCSATEKAKEVATGAVETVKEASTEAVETVKDVTTTGSACGEYISFMDECMEKLDPSISAAYKEGMDLFKEQIKTNGDAFEETCKQTLETTKPALAQMGC